MKQLLATGRSQRVCVSWYVNVMTRRVGLILERNASQYALGLGTVLRS
jgi:hypothetical protein